jgi:hypothetical protein
MQASTTRHRDGPLRVIVSCEQGSDGLAYEVLDCHHRVLLIAGLYGYVTSSRRHCPRCPRPTRALRKAATSEQ